jgi:hypothetical protein
MTNASDKQMALALFSDAFKEANGFRPRGNLVPSHLTEDEIWAKIEALYREANTKEAVISGAANWIDERDRPSIYEDFFGE